MALKSFFFPVLSRFGKSFSEMQWRTAARHRAVTSSIIHREARLDFDRFR